MDKINDNKILLLDFRPQFIEIASEILKTSFSSIAESKNYDIIAIDESGCVLKNNDICANYVLCPHSTPCRGNIYCKNIISCGMNTKSTFSISSTIEEKSLFSVNRNITLGDDILLPFEEYFVLDKRLSLYENIIIQGINKIVKYKI